MPQYSQNVEPWLLSQLLNSGRTESQWISQKICEMTCIVIKIPGYFFKFGTQICTNVANKLNKIEIIAKENPILTMTSV
jgi:hypothetical protein